MVSTKLSTELANFLAVYADLSLEKMGRLNDIYHPDIQFSDPAHQINGLEELLNYFTSLYQNLKECDFDIEQADQVGQQAYIVWKMTFSHPRLKQGQPIIVDGMTRLDFVGGKVIRHHDYFDLGAMLYEHIPVVGRVVSWVKEKLGQ